MSEKSLNQVPQLSHSRCLAAIATLAVSFLLTSGIGGALIYWSVKHAPSCNARIAVGRALAFPLAMLFVHIVGYRLWRRQYSPNRGDGRGLGLAVYRRPMKTALLQQATCLILAALTLDMGEAWHATLVAVLAYWMAACVIVARRLDAPTKSDLLFIRWSFFLIWLSTVIIGPMVWYRMEY